MRITKNCASMYIVQLISSVTLEMAYEKATFHNGLATGDDDGKSLKTIPFDCGFCCQVRYASEENLLNGCYV